MMFEDKELKVNEGDLEKISGGSETIYGEIICDVCRKDVPAAPVNNGHICFDCLEKLKKTLGERGLLDYLKTFNKKS